MDIGYIKMADLKIKISAETAQASKAFKDLAAESEVLQGKIKRLGADMGNKDADKFIQNQKLSVIAMQAAGKGTEALTKSHADYGRQIETLIKKGLSPESEAVQKLQKEYDGLTKQIEAETAARKVQENAWKVAAGAIAGMAAGVGAFLGTTIKSAAAVEAWTAAFTPMMGSTEKAVELVKRLNQEAVSTPFEMDAISDSIKRLLPAFEGDMEKAVKAFRLIGDTAGGNANSLNTLTTAYSKVLLTGKSTMKELNMIAGAGVPIFSELAKSQNVTVQEIMKMSSAGEITADVLSGVFTKMTEEGGLFYKGMETSAFTFDAMLLGIEENISLVAGQIGEEFLPAAKEMAEKIWNATRAISEWLSEGDNLENMLENAAIAIGTTTAALTAFVVVSKSHATITAMAGAIKALTIAITGPAGIAAVAIGGLALAIGIFIKYQNDLSKAGEREAAAIKKTSDEAEKLIADYRNVNGEKQLDMETSTKLIALYPGLAEKIDVTTASYEELLTAIKELNIAKAKEAADDWIKKYETELVAAENALKEYEEIREIALKNIEGYEFFGDTEAILRAQNDIAIYEEFWDAAVAKADNSKNQINAILGAVGKEYKDGQIIDIPMTLTPNLSGSDSDGGVGNILVDLEKSLQQRLSEIKLSDNAAQNEMINQVKSFLEQRADLERVDGEDRLAFYREQAGLLAEEDKLSEKEREAAQIAANEVWKELDDELTKAKQTSLANRLKLLEETEAQADLARQEKFRTFLQSRLDDQMEYDALGDENRTMRWAEQISFLEEQKKYILENTKLTEEERNSLEKAASEERRRIEEDEAKFKAKMLKESLSATSNFFGSIAELLDAAGSKSAAAAIVTKALSSAEAGINSYLAFTKALNDPTPMPTWLRAANAASILASGLAAQIRIHSITIPSAETGGDFFFPESGVRRADNVMMRVNEGERVSITPRGQEGISNEQRIIVNVDKQNLFDVVNAGIKSGDIFISTNNIGFTA